MPECEITPATVANDGDTARKWMHDGRIEQAGVLAQIAQAEAGAGIMAALIEIKDTLKSFMSEVEDMPGGVEVARATDVPPFTHADARQVFQQGVADLAHAITGALEGGLSLNPHEDVPEYTRRAVYLIANAVYDYGKVEN